MPNGREYELKLQLGQDATERLIAHPMLRVALPDRRLERLVSTYFDTPDSTLRRKRMALRVRQSAGGTTHTLKAAGRSAVDRDEWEHADDAPRPDLEWLRSTPLRSVFKDDAVAGALDARFTVDVERTVLPLEHGGSAIEVALDQGAIRAKGLSLAVNELELELKAGSRRPVMTLARALAQDLPLTLSLVSKAERGYAVADLSWGQPTKQLPLDLAGATTIADVFARLVQACLHTLSLNAALVTGGSGDDEDAVHKTRIAVRHLRAALALFRPALRRRRLRRLTADLKWISDKLGAARDADVFQHAAFDRAADSDDPPGAPAVADAMRALREEAHRDLHDALATVRWRLLLLDLLAFSADGVRRRWRDRRCRLFVRRRLGAHRRALAKRTRGWRSRSEGEMHDVRKRAKMLRYDLDLLQSLPKLGGYGRAVKALSADLHVLQETLGTVHDAVALRERLKAAIIDQPAPAGTSPSAWTDVRAAAADFLAQPSDQTATLNKAHASARRVRSSKAF